MSIEHTTPDAALDALRAALTQLHALAAAPSADPFYAHAAEQVAAIVAGVDSRASPGATIGLPDPPSPGAKAGPTPDQPEPPAASGGLDQVPPDPGLLPDPPNPG